MSELMNRLGNRYDKIIGYFRQHPYGSEKEAMSEFSRLLNPDKAIVLEALLGERCGDIEEIIWSLSNQYFRIGHEFYSNFDKWATLLINRCLERTIISSSFCDKLMSNLRTMATSGYQPAFTRDYEMALKRITAEKCEMTTLVKSLFEAHMKDEVLRPYSDFKWNEDTFELVPVENPNYANELKDFDSDRVAFINSL
jgi:hypothetical protein